MTTKLEATTRRIEVIDNSRMTLRPMKRGPLTAERVGGGKRDLRVGDIAEKRAEWMTREVGGMVGYPSCQSADESGSGVK
jgi:hypothetical protein